MTVFAAPICQQPLHADRPALITLVEWTGPDEQDTDDRPDEAFAVIEIPWLPNCYATLDQAVAYFTNIAGRLIIARHNYATGARGLGEVA